MASSREQAYRLAELMPLLQERLAAGQPVHFSPNGTSMLPLLRQGRDGVTLGPLPPVLRKYDIVLYRRAGGQYVLHRIVAVGHSYTCMGDNQFDPEPGVQRGQMLAVVTALTRGGRRCSVSAPGYWLYCRLWHHSRPLRRLWCRGAALLRRCL